MFEYLLQTQFNKNIIGYDNICKITKNIYHGNNKSLEYLNHFNIQKIIYIEFHDKVKNYRSIKEINKKISISKIIINKEDKLLNYYDTVWDLFEENYNKITLIYCEDGNISLILLISYLIAYKYNTYESAFNLINEKKGFTIHENDFEKSYIYELIELDNRLHNFKHLISLK